jgi:hypothetical protein
MPDTLKDLNKYVINGGDINTFFASIAAQNATGITAGMDMEEEGNQTTVMTISLKDQGYDDEYIVAQIEFLKDSGRLKTHSQKEYKLWEDDHKAEQAAILKSREEAITKDKEDRRAVKAKVSDFLKDTEEVAGFAVSKTDRKALPEYMVERTVTTKEGKKITSMQRDLAKVLNSATGSIQLAKLLKTSLATGELVFDEIKTDSETAAAKKLKDNIRRNKNTILSNSGGGGSSTKKRPLAEYFT